MDENDSRPQVGDEKLAGALSRQVWIGQQAPPPPGVTPPVRRLLVCDLPADATAGVPAADGLWTWFGDQITPGGSGLADDKAGVLLVNFMSIAPEYDAEFNDWYNTEHLVRLGTVNGLLAARRFRCRDAGEALNYLALYHLADDNVAGTPDWRNAAATPWTARIQKHRLANQRLMFKQRVS
jgi:hypothetical protein